jgi:hypothetical protein
MMCNAAGFPAFAGCRAYRLPDETGCKYHLVQRFAAPDTPVSWTQIESGLRNDERVNISGR